MSKLPFLATALIVTLIVVGCVAPPPVTLSQPTSGEPAQPPAAGVADAAPTATPSTAAPAGRGPRFGQASGMMQRHHAEVPAEYAGLVNPVPADEDSLSRGKAVYSAQCETCHGASGMGDGPAGQALDPAPAPIAHTSQMLSDGYVYWRITEGGHDFGTAMPVWGDKLSDTARWDVINYVRSLGGDTMGHGGMGGGRGRGQGQGAGQMQHQTQMLEAAIAAGLISEDDAAFFHETHAKLAEKYAAGGPGQGMMVERMVLDGQAVADGAITQGDADRYLAIHDKMMQVEGMQ